MAVSEIAATRKKRSLLRFWFPRIVLALWAIDLGVIAFWPSEGFEAGQRVMAVLGGTFLTFILLAIWLLIFSGYRWWWRFLLLFGSVLLVVGAALATVREVHFKGDMAPILKFRWQPGQEDLEARLEANRRQHGNTSELDQVELGLKPTDFPEYRGHKRDGIVQGPPLVRDWEKHPPREVWRQPSGGGYASFAVVGNAAITIEQRRDKEAVVCYDTGTGKERWVYEYPAFFKEVLGGNGPRATPTIAGNEVYSFGAAGNLVCLNAANGEFKWSVNILENNDNIMWGMSGSPLVYDNMVVVNPGAQRESAAGRALIAYDRADGKVVWSAGNAKAAYASPMLATLAGRKQILVFDAKGLAGFDAGKGAELWRFPWETYQDINVAQPIILDDDRVFISSGYGHGCALIKITEADGKWSAQEVWSDHSKHALHCKFSNPVFYQGYLYGLDEKKLVCFDAKAGKEVWRSDRAHDYGHGQLLLSGDLLIILAESGKLVLVEATPEGHHELGSIQVLEGDKTWNYPALADGKAYIRNAVEMACYDLTEAPKVR
jgi:outer membrane protein assembly factor BamB